MAKWLNRSLSRRGFLALSGLAAASSVVELGALRAMAAKLRPRSQYPVVVIGAGLGGLTAAAYLARGGFPVTVVEQHDVPGGYATSFDRDGGNFTFEVSLHETTARDSETELVLRETGVFDQVQAVRLPELLRILTPDYDVTWPQQDPNGFVRALAKHFPRERAGIQGFVDQMKAVVTELRRPLRRRGQRDITGLTLAQMLDLYLTDPKAKSALAAFWGYYGPPPSRLPAALYCLATGEYMLKGAYYYKPRSQALSDALSEVIENNGGQVLLDQEVEQILLSSGAVSGVRLADGRTLPARGVISNASAPQTINQMLPPSAVPESYRTQLAGRRPSLSAFIVWLGLNQDVTSRLPSYETFVFDTYDNDAEYAAQIAGQVEKTGLSVTLYDNAFPGYSRPGTNTMTIMTCCGYERWQPYAADYFAGRKQAYHREKQRLADILIAKTEQRLIPGLSQIIQVKVAATPLTCQRYTKNPQGAIYGFDDFSQPRLSNRTPVRGLYLASAWAGYAGFSGVQMGGRDAFQAFLEDWSA